MRPCLAPIAFVFALLAGCTRGEGGSAETASADVTTQTAASNQVGGLPKTPHKPMPAAVRFQPTTALVKDAELVTRVDALAASKRIESSHIGAGGVESDVYKLFLAVLDKATTADLKALLRHESPVVRGYVAQHVANKEASLMEDVAALLTDKTPVDSMSGCEVGRETVAGVVVDALCYSDVAVSAEVLRDLVGWNTDHSSAGLGCLAKKKDGRADLAVETILSDPSRSAELREQALRVFTIAPAASQCAAIRAAAAKDTEPQRALYVGALSRCDDKASVDLLEDIATKTTGTVQTEAKVALLLHSMTPAARRSELAKEDGIRNSASPRFHARTTAASADAGLVKVAEALAEEVPSVFAPSIANLPVSSDATAMMRRLAKKHPAGTAHLRPAVLRYLTKVKDAADLDQAKASLDSSDSNEVLAAIAWVSATKSSTLRPQLEAIVSKNDERTKGSAQAALKAL